MIKKNTHFPGKRSELAFDLSVSKRLITTEPYFCESILFSLVNIRTSYCPTLQYALLGLSQVKHRPVQALVSVYILVLASKSWLDLLPKRPAFMVALQQITVALLHTLHWIITVAVSMEINKRHYIQSNLHTMCRSYITLTVLLILIFRISFIILISILHYTLLKKYN